MVTPRLRIRPLSTEDASFIHHLVNDPDWIRFIGDKQVRSLDDARAYIENGPMKMYREQGFGLKLVALKADEKAIGICGLLKRENLEFPDLGFALLPEFRRQGYASEAARAILQDARKRLKIQTILAITKPENKSSQVLLQALGFVRQNQNTAADGTAINLYSITQ